MKIFFPFKLSSFFLISCLIVSSLAGCSLIDKTNKTAPTSPSNTPPYPSQTKMTIPSQSASTHVTRQITPSPSPISVVTLSETESYDNLLWLLTTNGGCELPCLWNVIPGVTSTDMGVEVFNHLGWEISNNNRADLYEAEKVLNKEISITTKLLMRDNLVKAISFGITGDKFTELNQYYSITNTFSHLGVPDAGWINLAIRGEVIEPEYTNFEIVLYYEKEQLVVKHSGRAKKVENSYSICPSYPLANDPEEFNTQGAMVMMISSISGNLGPEDIMKLFGASFIGTKTIEEALGMKLDEFTILLQTNDANCFNLPINIWP